MATPNASNNIWNIVVPVMVVLLIVFIIGISFWFWRDIGEGSGSYTTLTPINQNIILRELFTIFPKKILKNFLPSHG